MRLHKSYDTLIQYLISARRNKCFVSKSETNALTEGKCNTGIYPLLIQGFIHI